ncbi:MAG: NAD(P)/FAD-dependent oxidoreductase [Pseudomonadota bacterium]
METETVVIGAGVVGLAVAARLAAAGQEVVVLERNDLIGAETSARNSEVIHAGIYYATGSSKARLCVRGKALLYAHCAEHAVPHRNCGKLIVATRPDQYDTLRGYQQAALTNGAGALRWVETDELRDLEPAVDALAGVYSPTTGIIDSHQYMLSLQGLLERHGGMIALGTAVDGLSIDGARLQLATSQGQVTCRRLVNSAGLWAPGLGSALDRDGPKARYAIGHYYSYAASPFNRLVYPVAEAGGLGVHVTLDLGGQTRFGPDVRWIDEIDYAFDDSRREEFVAAILRYFPSLERSRLLPGYTGIRPKLELPAGVADDFQLRGPETHGIDGFVNLLGIESPGLTASLAIAEAVEERLAA